MTTKSEVTKDSVIGEVIKTIPGAEDVIRKYFGTGCFTCPGINIETIAFGSTMHNVDPDVVVNAIKEITEVESGT